MARNLFLFVFWVGRLLTTIFAFASHFLQRLTDWILRLVDRKSWAHTVAAQNQAHMLAELDALSDAIKAKKRGSYFEEDPWPMHEVMNLSMAVEELEELGWDPEDCSDFVRRLSDGVISFGELQGFDFDDDDHELIND
jgi:hypothetical protein